MKTPMISIIIPMYNEENNIEACIESLRSQTSQNFHVVFIDDGSTDDTLKNLKNSLKNKTIRFSYNILTQSNSGAAKARKTGISATNTPYILPVDCDDTLSNNAIFEIEKSIKKHNFPDMSLLDLKIEDENGVFQNFVYFCPDEILPPSKCLEFSLGCWKVHGLACTKKEVFIKSLNFYNQVNPSDTNYWNNDEIITRLNFFFSNLIVRNEGIYYYHANPQSSTKSINKRRYLMCRNAIVLYNFFGQNMGDISLNAQKGLIDAVWDTYGYLKRNKSKLPNKYDWINEIKNTIKYILSQKNFSLTFKEKLKLYRRYISVNFI